MANLFDDCNQCSGYPKHFKTAVSIHSVGYDGYPTGKNYAWVHIVNSYTMVKVGCNCLESEILRSVKLPLFAHLCWHNVEVLDIREFNGIEAEKENKQLLDFHYTTYNQEEEDIDDRESETIGQTEKVETEDSVKLTWSIPQEFERIKAQAKRLKDEKKKWKRDFKALKDWVGNFQRIIENAQKSLSIIGDQNEKGTKDENRKQTEED